jgi:hypothetical protein
MTPQLPTDSLNLSLSDFVQWFANVQDEHLRMLDQTTTPDCAPVDAVRHLIAAALRRSGALIEGFLTLIDMRNRFCAIPLIRLQLDSAMRVHACASVTDATAFVKHVLEGGEPKKYKPRDYRLQDKDLYESLTANYPYTGDLYRETNGFIHLSIHHLFGFFDQRMLASGIIQFTDHDNSPQWDESDRNNTMVSMMWATHVLTEECRLLMKKYPVDVVGRDNSAIGLPEAQEGLGEMDSVK